MKRIALAFAIALAPLPVLAGTTGWMTGTVTDRRDGAPLANVSVTASSPTQIAKTTTDSHGRFCFISLTPDTYYVAIERDGFMPAGTYAFVFADMPKHVPLLLEPVITGDWYTSSRPYNAGSLVQEGTSGDVYGYDSLDFLVAPPVQTDYWMLRMLPGITGGAGRAGAL